MKEYLIDNANKEETQNNFQKVFQAISIDNKQEGKRIIIPPLNSEPLADILKEEGIDYVDTEEFDYSGCCKCCGVSFKYYNPYDYCDYCFDNCRKDIKEYYKSWLKVV